MKHNIKQRKLNRTSEHRKALLMNLSNSLIKHEQITTTLPKAKELRQFIEKVITLGKKGTLHHRRQASALLTDEYIVKKVFEVLAPRFEAREKGGYTRLTKLGPRKGDAAEMAVLEFVE